jgi:hypothetical protein
LHILARKRIDDLLGVKVHAAVGCLLEKLAAAGCEEFVVCYLHLERLGVPLVIELDIVGVDEGQLLIRCFRGQDVGEGDVFETHSLPDFGVVWEVNSTQ